VVYQKRPVCICKRDLYTSEETCKRDEIRSSERDEKRSTSLLTERDEICVSKETRSDLRTSKETTSDLDSFDPKRRNLCVKRDLYVFAKETYIHQRRPAKEMKRK